MYKYFIALRYLRSHWIILLCILGVAIGIAMTTVVNSVMGGFSRDIRSRIRGMQAHLVIRGGYLNEYLPDSDELVRRIRRVRGVRGAAPRVQYLAWLEGGFFQKDVVLIGIDPAMEADTSRLSEYFRRGGKFRFDFRFDDRRIPARPGIVIGEELAKMWGKDTKERRWLGAVVPVSTFVRTSKFGALRSRDFTVVGVFNSGMAEYDSRFVFMELEAAQRFLKLRGPHQKPVVSYIAVQLENYRDEHERVRRDLVEVLHSYRPCYAPADHEKGTCGTWRIRTWEEEKSNLLRAVAIEKGLTLVLLFSIVIVAGFLILATYTMMVRMKIREIGILRSLGATTVGIALVFLLSGLLCGVIGSLLGVIGGLKLAHNLNSVAEFVETGSKDLAAWARGHPTGFLVQNAGLLGAGIVGLLGLTLALSIFARGPIRTACTLPFSALWILILLAAASGMLVDSASGIPRDNPLWSIAVSAGVLAAAVTAGAIPLALRTARFRGWILRLRRAALALAGATVLLSFTGILGRDAFWEFLVGEFVFTAVLAFTLIHLAFREMLDWRRSATPLVLNAVLLAMIGTLCLPLAAFLRNPPAEDWPGLNLFPKDVYYLDRIPSEIHYPTILALVAGALITSILFSLWPAVRAAKEDPVEVIRRE